MQPFFDLVERVRPRDAMRVVDLGCGTGELTALLAERLPGSTVLGIDSSPSMLERARPRASERVRFEPGDVARFDRVGEYDLVFSNATLQWVPDHERVVPALLRAMRPGAQIAVQVPNNYDHASHKVAEQVATSGRFRALLGGYVRSYGVQRAEWYAEQLWAQGFRDVWCVEKIYGHELEDTAAVVEWVKGTLLTAYTAKLSPGDAQEFLEAYRARLLATLGRRAPYFYAFRRLLFSAVKPA
jgi:trans-aconitate 2-methyltransferase